MQGVVGYSKENRVIFMIKAKFEDRQFERLIRWNVLDYTYVTRKSTFAKYADNYNSNDIKLCLTRFRFNNNWEPLNKYQPITPIQLANGSVISRKSEDGLYLEMNDTKDKVRLYKEILSEG